MTYATPFQLTADSALYTARFSYRKGRRDIYRARSWATAIATHPRTVKAAKLTVWFFYVAAVFAWALGETARIGWDYAKARAALEVEANLPKPAAIAPVAEPEPEPVAVVEETPVVEAKPKAKRAPRKAATKKAIAPKSEKSEEGKSKATRTRKPRVKAAPAVTTV